MNTYERQQRILQLLQENGSIKVVELAAQLDVSEGTIRNDLNALEEQNLLERIHGGAIPVNGNKIEPIFNSRVQINADSKRKIARWASELVADGDVLLLDASSTCYHMATYLEDRHNITVVTNHLETARLLSTDPTKRVLLPGGNLRPDGLSVTGEIAQDVLRHLRANTAYLSCVGFSPQSGLMEADLQEAHLKQQMIQSAAQVVALVDSSKFGKIGLKAFASMDQISHLVTDDGVAPQMIERLLEAGISLTICGESSVQSLTPQRQQTHRHYRIGFANLSEALPFSIDVRRSLERAAKACDTLDIVYVDNNLDGDTAIRLADKLIEQEVDLVIEYQIDEMAGNIIMNKFKQRQIPIIAVDIPMIGATYFGVDNFAAGHMAGHALGRWIQKHWQGQVDHVVVLEEKRAGSLPAARIQGQLQGLREIVPHISDDMLIFIDSGNASAISYRHVLHALHVLPAGVRLAFVCFNDDAAMGALQAVRELGWEDRVTIVGQGADRQVRSEIRGGQSPIIGSTAFMPEQYGEHLIEIALKILEGAAVPPAVYMQHQFIDKSSIDQYYLE